MAHASNGCSPKNAPEPKWAAPIRNPAKSHNLRAEVLVGRRGRSLGLVCSLIATAKLNNVEPYAYLKACWSE
ncbi:MAG: transposase domain-containing protein [Reyranella sp.]|nr:transposase domain-containing protein [Reyranella sp.]